MFGVAFVFFGLLDRRDVFQNANLFKGLLRSLSIPSKKKIMSKSAAKKNTKAAAPAPVEPPAPVAAAKEVETPVAEKPEKPSVTTNLEQLESDLKTLQATMKSMVGVLKLVARDVKSLQAFQTKHAKKPPRAPREPSGFARKTQVSEELYKFLGLPKGTEIAGTKVTSMINEYIKKHNLQNPEDRREIFPDAKLKAILRSGEEKVTYFNMQRFLKPHYVKTAANMAAAAAAAPAVKA